jgi:predicted RNase H-like nuclease (RuvC/YqgF family)
MSKIRKEGKVPPPPLDEDGNPIEVEDGSETSKAPTLEELMKKLKKLKDENKKLKAKHKKGKTCSSSSEDDGSSCQEETSNKGKKGWRKHDKPSYNSMSFIYNNMPSATAYTSVPIGKAPNFDGSNYN